MNPIPQCTKIYPTNWTGWEIRMDMGDAMQMVEGIPNIPNASSGTKLGVD